MGSSHRKHRKRGLHTWTHTELGLHTGYTQRLTLASMKWISTLIRQLSFNRIQCFAANNNFGWKKANKAREKTMKERQNKDKPKARQTGKKERGRDTAPLVKCQVRHNADTGSILQCGKGVFFPVSTFKQTLWKSYGAHTAHMCNCTHQHLCTS